MEYAVNVRKCKIKKHGAIVGKGEQMNMKRKRAFLLVICILFLFVTFASLFYIAKEENHRCTGKDCPICAIIHQAEQTVKNLGNGAITVETINPLIRLLVILTIGQFLFVFVTSLVSQKVRLND